MNTGKQFSSSLNYLARETSELTAFGENITRVYTDNDSWRGRVPAFDSAHPDNSRALLKQVSRRQLGPGLHELTLRYEQTTVEETATVPEDEVVESGATVEVDIKLHPIMGELTGTPPAMDVIAAVVAAATAGTGAPDHTLGGTEITDTDDLDRAAWLYRRLVSGQTNYLVGTGQVAITTFSVARPDTVQPDLGHLADPGHGLGESGHWLVITGGVSQRGGFWARTLVYQYSAVAIPTDGDEDSIYGDDALNGDLPA